MITEVVNITNIKSYRVRAGLTQAQLAKTLGIRQSTVAMWETGKAMPQADKLPELSRILGCTIDDLFKGKEEKS